MNSLPMRLLLPSALLAFSFACGRSTPPVTHAATTPSVSPAPSSSSRHQVRLSGVIQAVHYYNVQVPQITGQGGRMTLTRLVPNGTGVKAGDIVAEFDRTQQLDNARDAQAKFDDLSHQVEQKRAQNRADAEKRIPDDEHRPPLAYHLEALRNGAVHVGETLPFHHRRR